jgi:hypothetical protein
MSAVWDRLAELSEQQARPLDELVRHHVLEGILRRLARVPDAAEFVLRGSMLTRAWVAPQRRVADDLDFVGTFPHSVEETRRKFAPALAVDEDDDVCLDAASLRAHALWPNTPFPGVRLTFRAGLGAADQLVQTDVGFNDPLVPPAYLYEYPTVLPGAPLRLMAVRPETAIAWKLHGLAEMGPTGWRPKDLHDLYLIVPAVVVDETALTPAIEAAFISRGYQQGDAPAVFTTSGWWDLKGAQVKWREYCRRTSILDTQEELAAVVESVRRRLWPVLAALAPTCTSQERHR